MAAAHYTLGLVLAAQARADDRAPPLARAAALNPRLTAAQRAMERVENRPYVSSAGPRADRPFPTPSGLFLGDFPKVVPGDGLESRSKVEISVAFHSGILSIHRVRFFPGESIRNQFSRNLCIE